MFKITDGIFIGFMSLVAVIGILGNVFTVYVMITKKLLKGRLWYYLLSLSCSDIFSFATIMPLTMIWFYYDQLHHKRFLCNLQGSSMNFLMGWSLITIGFVNIAKYRCIKTPVVDKKQDRRRLMIYIFAFFPTSLFISMAPTMGFSTYVYLPRRNFCELKASNKYNALVFTQLSASLVLSIIVVFTNVATAQYVRKKTDNYTKRYGANGPMEENFHQRTSRVYHTTLLITVMFFICWVPLHVIIIMQNFGEEIPLSFAKISYFFAFLQGCLNPIIYCFRHYVFKKQLKRIWQCFKLRRRATTNSNAATSSSHASIT